MNRQEVLRRVHEVGVMPVVRAASAEEALQVIEAIRAGGVSILEITMTVPRAVRLIEQVADRYGDEVVVGAGTVLDAETARACILAGASFVVSPSLNIDTIEMYRRYSIAVIPGALTPTEVVTAWQAGADVVKIFPGVALGGAHPRNLFGERSHVIARRTLGSKTGDGHLKRLSRFKHFARGEPVQRGHQAQRATVERGRAVGLDDECSRALP